MLALEATDDGVAVADTRPAGAVVVERQRSRGLADERRDQLVGRVGPAADDAVGVLPQLRGDARVCALDREGERDRRRPDASTADPRGEAAGELAGRVEAERAARDDLEVGHRASMRRSGSGAAVSYGCRCRSSGVAVSPSVEGSSSCQSGSAGRAG